MGRLFGTDGVRGVAGIELTAEITMEIGRAAAAVLTKGRRRRPLVVIGKDTRISSDMLEAALCAGLCSVGADVITLGVIPTPAVAYLVGKYKADAGVMISASHNSYEYNGIKIFGGEGFKLPDELEDRIEALVLDKAEDILLATPQEIGTCTHCDKAASDYVDYLKTTVPFCLEGMSIAVDCANGSACATAQALFNGLGANATFIHNTPNGININENCGSTHTESLLQLINGGGFDAGVAFDGDADRCLFYDECGGFIDGDFIMAMCALDMKSRGKLHKSTVVGTIMANMGFAKFCEANGIIFIPTKVGDRYVLEEMELEGYKLGGEQSGHIIFRDFATTGDGQLTAIQLFNLMRRSKKPMSKLAKTMTHYPQVMKNLTVSKEGKLAFYNDETVKAAIQAGKDELLDKGRVVVRVSGTEPLIRVMVEGESENQIEKIAQQIAEVCLQQLS